jgi:hypothetical protein
MSTYNGPMSDKARRVARSAPRKPTNVRLYYAGRARRGYVVNAVNEDVDGGTKPRHDGEVRSVPTRFTYSPAARHADAGSYRRAFPGATPARDGTARPGGFAAKLALTSDSSARITPRIRVT